MILTPLLSPFKRPLSDLSCFTLSGSGAPSIEIFSFFDSSETSGGKPPTNLSMREVSARWWFWTRVKVFTAADTNEADRHAYC